MTDAMKESRLMQPAFQGKPEKKEAMRAETFAGSFQYGIKPRFGLFSQPVSNAIGETNTMGQKAFPERDEQGLIVLAPPNFYTNKGQKGPAIDRVLFEKHPTYLAVGDPFKQRSMTAEGRTTNKNGHIQAGHDYLFKPAKHFKNHKFKQSYSYMPLGPKPKKNYKDKEEGVLIGPRNFTTMPLKRGKLGKGVHFGGKIPYMEDDYNRKKALDRKEMEYHHSKVQEKPWSQQAKKLTFGTFNNPIDVIGTGKDVPSYTAQPEPVKKNLAPSASAPQVVDEPLHDRAFRPGNPAKTGNQSTIAKFPVWNGNPPKQLKRKVKDPNEEDIPAFKMTTKEFTRPTPSVACNFRNLKTQFPSAFRR